MSRPPIFTAQTRPGIIHSRRLQWRPQDLQIAVTKSARDILQKIIPANSCLSSKQNAARHEYAVSL
ncbi:MAG: hypothetical protein CVU16_09995 [Betaproteobacteria bacterium HGW-Betaproteobacteria-10]|nr:MAG: hypothetical protein CVU16_09995 [Betaproteobacteria bacterium HGW-Betaproteobacteria-10]